MKEKMIKIAVVCIALLYIQLHLVPQANASPAVCISPQSAQLKNDLRRLWIDHTVWTRSYITSAISHLEDQDKVLARLLKNQEDIGNAIKPYYGAEAGNQLTKLLKEHILLAGKVVDAARDGQQKQLQIANKQWYKNADEIAQFLSNANPNWKKKDLQQLLYGHLELLTDQVVSRIKKDWNGDILAFDRGEDHIIKLADTLAIGIQKQFPEKF